MTNSKPLTVAQAAVLAAAERKGTGNDEWLYVTGNGNVLRGLRKRGLCGEATLFRDGARARLTNEGVDAWFAAL